MAGSTSTAHASTPPRRLWTSAKPALRSHIAACWLRLPWWQTRTRSRSRGSSPTRRAAAPAERHRAVDPAVLELPRLAHVDQRRRDARGVGAPRRELGGVDLRNQNLNRAGAAAFSSGSITVSNRSVVVRAPGPTQRDEPRRHHRRIADDREHAAAGLQLRDERSRAGSASSRSARSRRTSPPPAARAVADCAARRRASPRGASLRPASAASRGSISTLVTRAPRPASSAVK